MKKLKILFGLFLLFSNNYGQKITTVVHGNESDSSFYHIAKISDNEFWAGGENGILKSIDTLGNIIQIDYQNSGQSILKIERIKDFVYILTDDAIIYRYDLVQKLFIKKEFPKLKNKCFYDLVELPNGKFMVCGGAKEISQGVKKIPQGFIAELANDLSDIKPIWKSYRKFVWSLLKSKDESILASTFNGFNTKIIKMDYIQKNNVSSYTKWKTESKIKGLIHEIALFNNNLWYSGSPNVKFRENGIYGQKEKNIFQTNKTGCLFSMALIKDKIIAVSEQGNLLRIDPLTFQFEKIRIPNSPSLYDIENISDTKIFVVGHGKSIFLLDFQ